MFHQVTAAIDGSPISLHALDTAAHIASQDNAELQIVSVVEPLPLILAGTPRSPINETHIENQYQIYRKLHQEQRRRLRETYPHLKTTSAIKTGRPAKTISETTLDTDLIVVGHRGLGGLDSLVLGSVAEELLDQCTAPVLVIKATNLPQNPQQIHEPDTQQHQ